MTAGPAEYRWSSYRAHAGLDPIPEWLYSEWLFDMHPEPAKCHEMYREVGSGEVGSGLCSSSIRIAPSTHSIETVQYLLGMETASVGSVEFLRVKYGQPVRR